MTHPELCVGPVWHLHGKGALPRLWRGRWLPAAPTFLRSLQAPNASVLLFFHNAAEGKGSGDRLAVDGSFLAAVGNLIVVTASYRTGIFGFLSSGELLGLVGTADSLSRVCCLCAFSPFFLKPHPFQAPSPLPAH